MYVHCNSCHHEWECTDEDGRKCDWCGGESYILEDETPLENIEIDVLTSLAKLNNPYADKIIEKIKNKTKK